MFRLARLMLYYLTIQFAPIWYKWKHIWMQRHASVPAEACGDATTEKPCPYPEGTPITQDTQDVP